VGGSLRGDISGSLSGQLLIEGASVGAVTISGSIIGGAMGNSGRLDIDGPALSLLIKGHIIGGTAGGSGEVDTDALNAFTLGGSLIGGSGANSGTVGLGSAKVVTVNGSMLGGSGGGSADFFINEGKSKVLVKGSIAGGQITNSPSSTTGVFSTSGSFSSFTLKGDLVAGRTVAGAESFFNGAILSFGPIGVLTIGGSVLGNNQTHAVISSSTAPVNLATGLETALGIVKVARDVTFTEFLAGYSVSTTPGYTTAIFHPDAGIGSITVGGSWFHSIAMAGVEDVGQDGPTTNDIRPAASSADVTAGIGSVIIKGSILDSAATSGFGGFQAEQIGKIIAAGRVLYKTGDGMRLLEITSNTFAREI
jgi:hypothetical protein